METALNGNNEFDILLKFIGSDKKVLKYLHNTREEQIAKAITIDGFQFEKYLENTSDLVSGLQAIEIRYFMHIRKSYGNFTIIMEIARETVNFYSSKLQGTPYHFTEVLSKYPPEESVDGEPIYTLPEQFVKGYYNRQTKQVFKNPTFDPYYKCAAFDKNLEGILA